MQQGYCGAALAVVSAVLLCLTIWVLVKNPGATEEVACSHGHFLHGVASGEPHDRGIVLWTRISPKNVSATNESIKVHWQVWREADGLAIVAEPVIKGETSALPSRDFTVKLDIRSDLLKPKVRYAYQFSAGSESSPVGKFRLPPARGEPLNSLKYAVFSCSNWQRGYFNAYGAAARESLDLWLHVGDYIYEHSREEVSNEEAVRPSLDPAHETVSLEDYRRRHAMYRTDPDLQKLSSSAPLVAIWDDHEVANNAWTGGAGGHAKADGNYTARREAGLRAYHEWLPTRTHAEVWTDSTKAIHGEAFMWRRLDFGDLASLMVLETRHAARTDPSAMTREKVTSRMRKILESGGYPPPEKWPGSKVEKDFQALHLEVEKEMRRPEKRIVGKEQMAWLKKEVQNSVKGGTKWRLIAQSAVVQEKYSGDYEEAIKRALAIGHEDLAEQWKKALTTAIGMPNDSKKKEFALVNLAASRYKINMGFDDWMGYDAERQRLLGALDTGEPATTLMYGGDSHNAWAGSLLDSSGKTVAVEFDGMSVTSPGAEYFEPRLPPDFEAAAWEAANGELAWADTHSRGFMLVSLTNDTQHLEYRGVDVKTQGKSKSKCLSAFGVKRGTGPRRADCHAQGAVLLSTRSHARAALRQGVLSASAPN